MCSFKNVTLNIRNIWETCALSWNSKIHNKIIIEWRYVAHDLKGFLHFHRIGSYGRNSMPGDIDLFETEFFKRRYNLKPLTGLQLIWLKHVKTVLVWGLRCKRSLKPFRYDYAKSRSHNLWSSQVRPLLTHHVSTASAPLWPLRRRITGASSERRHLQYENKIRLPVFTFCQPTVKGVLVWMK